MSNSIQKMINEKVIKRTDKGMFAALEQFHFTPGFNKRREGPKLDASIERSARSLIKDEATKTLVDINNVLPQIEVQARPEGGLKVIEGHRRIRALRLLESWGYTVPLVGLKPFIGNELECKARIVTSQSQEPLDPVELADVVRDFAETDGLSAAQIAKLVGFSRQYVEQLLKIAHGGEDVRDLIDQDVIAPGTAVKALRAFGEEAAAEIRTISEEAGGAKVTPKMLEERKTRKALPALPPAIPRALSEDLLAASLQLVAELPESILEQVERYRTGETVLGSMTVPLTIRSLNAVVATARHVRETHEENRRKAELKAAEKAREDGDEQ